MANYSTTTWQSAESNVIAVLALLETKLETLDSTSNPLYLIKIKMTSPGKYVAIMNYD